MQSFISELLVKNPNGRLGGEDVKDHAFFFSIDWALLETGEAEPPFRPRGEDNFHAQFTKQRPQLSTRNSMDADMMAEGDEYLADFSFYPEQE